MLRILALTIVWPLRALFALVAGLVRLPRRSPAWLELSLTGELSFRRLEKRRLWGRKPRGNSVQGIREALERARSRARVEGVLIRLGGIRGSAAAIDAVAAELVRFRDAGKKVVVFAIDVNNADAPLLAPASRVVLAPGTSVLLLGLSARVTSLKDALDRVGIAPEFFRRGRFKSAPETFTRADVSEEHRSFVDSVLDHHHRRILTALAERCHTDKAGAAAVLDGGPYTSSSALRSGLCDDLAFPDETAKILGVPEKPEPHPAHLSALAGKTFRFPPAPWPRPAIGVVRITGIIKPGPSVHWPGGTRMAGADSVVADLEAARKHRGVRAVLLAVDSRGGAAPASELMWHAVRRCAAEKPVVAYVEQVAASGGYFAAAGARRIVAAPSALVGSIGAFMGRFGARTLLERFGINQEVFLRGARAGILDPAHVLTEADRQALDRSVGETYDEFVDRVAEGRGVPREKILEVAEGRVFVAASAPPVLVDEVGDFEVALGWAAGQAGLDPLRAPLALFDSGGVRPGLRQLVGLAAIGTWLLWDDVLQLG